MRIIRMVCILLICILLGMCLTGCQNPIVMKRRPSSQPNTKWQSTDGRVYFEISKGNVGTILTDKGVVKCAVKFDSGAGMKLLDPIVLETNAVYSENIYEKWLCSFKSKDMFIATMKKTTYFEVGEEITFYKIGTQ